jgi:hypothetical protein
MLSATAFVGIYAQAAHVKGVMLGAAALPNVSFVVGVILTIVFAFDPDLPTGQGRLGQVRRLFGGGAAAAPRGGPLPSPTQVRRDPFA